MVHGFLAHARCFAFVAPLLANDFHVTALDLSGMGDSGRRSSYETATRARELMALLRHLGMTEHETKPFIVSHSYGGTIGLEAMEHHGADLGGLVICDMMVMRPKLLDAYYNNMQEHRRARPPTLYPDLATAMGRYRLMPPQICANRYLMQYMAYHSLREETGGWAWKFDPLILEGDARDQTWWGERSQKIASLAGKKAILHGQESLLFNDDSAAYLRELGAQDLSIFALPGAHHHLMLDEPVAFAETLRTILQGWIKEDKL